MSRTSQRSIGNPVRARTSFLARFSTACRNAIDAIGPVGRSQTAAPPFARKMLFETLEQRLLLSADLAPTASAFVPASQLGNQSAPGSAFLSLTDGVLSATLHEIAEAVW